MLIISSKLTPCRNLCSISFVAESAIDANSLELSAALTLFISLIAFAKLSWATWALPTKVLAYSLKPFTAKTRDLWAVISSPVVPAVIWDCVNKCPAPVNLSTKLPYESLVDCVSLFLCSLVAWVASLIPDIVSLIDLKSFTFLFSFSKLLIILSVDCEIFCLDILFAKSIEAFSASIKLLAIASAPALARDSPLTNGPITGIIPPIWAPIRPVLRPDIAPCILPPILAAPSLEASSILVANILAAPCKAKAKPMVLAIPSRLLSVTLPPVLYRGKRLILPTAPPEWYLGSLSALFNLFNVFWPIELAAFLFITNSPGVNNAGVSLTFPPIAYFCPRL